MLVACTLAADVRKQNKDPVHIANVMSGNYHIAYLPEQDLIVSKAGLGPGATGIDIPMGAPPVAQPKEDVYRDHAGSKCDTIQALEFEATPVGCKGAASSDALGASKGKNSLYFSTDGTTNTTSCDMDDGCTTKMVAKERSFTTEAPAQTSLVRFALNYGEEDGGEVCDKRRDERVKAYLKATKEEETYKIKKAEEELKAAMAKCTKGEQYSTDEKACEACPDGKFNDQRGGKPCKDRLAKCPAGEFLNTKDKDAAEDYDCKPCGDEEFSGDEDAATTCKDWKEECPAGEGWDKGSTKKDASCTACAAGTFKASKDDDECKAFSFKKNVDCKAGFKLLAGTASKDSVCVSVPKGFFRAEDMDEPKAHKTGCPAGEELKGGSKTEDKKCTACSDGRFKAEEGNARCKLQQVCDGTGEKTKTKGDAKTNTICECSDGFKTIKAKDGNGIDCEPINMCTNGKHNCDDNAKCSYRGPGKFDCKCKKGFWGTGQKCDAHKKVCPAGQELKGGSSTVDKTCETCPDGKFKSKADGSECVDFKDSCPAGEELIGGDAKTDKECKACRSSFFKKDEGEDPCQRRTDRCPAGQQLKAGGDAKTDDSCVGCPDDTYKSAADGSKCKPHTKECEAGFKLKKGTSKTDSKCNPCPSGKFKAGTNGAKVCKAWTQGCDKAGTYWKAGSRTADRSCPPCADGEFNDAAGAKKGEKCKAMIQECGAGTEMTAPKGKDDKTVNRKCVACFEGKYRSGAAKGHNAALDKKCVDHYKSNGDCKSPDPKIKYFNIKCKGGSDDPKCAKVQLACEPDEAKNSVISAELKCKSACSNGKPNFDKEAWSKDVAAGKKLDPNSAIFHYSSSVSNKNGENPMMLYCTCDCNGQDKVSTGGVHRHNEFVFDYFARPLPGCRRVQGGTRTCYSVGDPHPRTFDGMSYNYYQYGEYVFSYRQDYSTETRLTAGMLHPKIAAGTAAAMRSEKEICSCTYGNCKCSTSFTNDAEYAKFEASETDYKDNNKVKQMYQNGKRNCGGNVWGGKSPTTSAPIRIQGWSNGRMLTGADGTLLQFNFWRSGCYRGRGHASAGSRGNDGTGGHCGGRWYMNNYVRLVGINRGVDKNAVSYGICGTPGTGYHHNRAEVGLNTGTQSGRNDPRRTAFFQKVKLPGAARYARDKSGARMDFRSFFWCNGNDNEFMHTSNDQAEHPKNGQRFWSFMEMEQSEGKASKFRALRSKATSLLEMDDEPAEEKKEEPKKEEEAAAAVEDKDPDDKKNPDPDDEEEAKKTKAKEAPANDDTNAKVDKKKAEAECEKKGIKKKNPKGEVAQAWTSCVEDVQVVGDDEKAKEDVTKAAEEEEKDDDKTEDEAEKDEKQDKEDEVKDEAQSAKERNDAVAPLLEVCIMGAGKDCKDDKSFTEVVALPSKAFDKKEWNTIKVLLPVKKGERATIRFRQKETECECCNDWGIDSLQFLAGDECAPGAINRA
jgi:hypothetical protein